MEQEHVYIKQVLSGQTEAYRHLVERYNAGLIIHCEQLLKDRDEAEDVAQDAFIHAYEKLAVYNASTGRRMTVALPAGSMANRQASGDDLSTPVIGSVVQLTSVSADKNAIAVADLVYMDIYQ